MNHATHFLSEYGNESFTLNGAKGLRTTLHPLLDLNFKVCSLRGMSAEEITTEFTKAYVSNNKYAIKWLFFLRDIQQGLGERRGFRICLSFFANSQPEIVRTVIKLLPEYGRFDDLLCLINSPLRKDVCTFMHEQLDRDIANARLGKPVSLLAKWLPSINTSSKETIEMAKVISKEFEMNSAQYRKTLSSLRRYLNVLEVKLSANQWAKVEYENVPAKANLKYDKAFKKRDEERRNDFLLQAYLKDGKINTKGIAPYEVVGRFHKDMFLYNIEDDLLSELMWKHLLRQGYKNEWGLSDCIVVADSSGSMLDSIRYEKYESYDCYKSYKTSKVCALDVAYSLAIYFAEQSKGPFHDISISFSERPEFIDLSRGKTLKDKLEIMLAYSQAANTNIEAVFDMLLEMAVSKKVPSNQLPKQVLIISDMEFDEASDTEFDQTLFDSIEEKYCVVGYKMPRLIFWNLCSKTNTIPKVDNKKGICLLSGFSQNAIKVAANREITDPYKSLLRILDSPRYDKVEMAIKGVL